MKNPGKITRENILYHRNIDSYSISSGIAFRWPGVPYQMIRKNPVFMRVCGLSEQKSGNEKVEIHGPGSFFIDDTIHDGAEQKSFFLGWFLWIFQNIIDVFYLFPEIFF